MAAPQKQRCLPSSPIASAAVDADADASWVELVDDASHMACSAASARARRSAAGQAIR